MLHQHGLEEVVHQSDHGGMERAALSLQFGSSHTALTITLLSSSEVEDEEGGTEGSLGQRGGLPGERHIFSA